MYPDLNVVPIAWIGDKCLSSDNPFIRSKTDALYYTKCRT